MQQLSLSGDRYSQLILTESLGASGISNGASGTVTLTQDESDKTISFTVVYLTDEDPPTVDESFNLQVTGSSASICITDGSFTPSSSSPSSYRLVQAPTSGYIPIYDYNTSSGVKAIFSGSNQSAYLVIYSNRTSVWRQVYAGTVYRGDEISIGS